MRGYKWPLFNIYYLSSSGFFCDRIQSAYIMGVSSQAKYRLIGNLITTINRFSVFSVELRVNPRRFINFVHNVEKVVWRNGNLAFPGAKIVRSVTIVENVRIGRITWGKMRGYFTFAQSSVCRHNIIIDMLHLNNKSCKRHSCSTDRLKFSHTTPVFRNSSRASPCDITLFLIFETRERKR